jgi:hypothetical protein
MALIPFRSQSFETFSNLREAMLEIYTGLTQPYDDNNTLSEKVQACKKTLQVHIDSLISIGSLEAHREALVPIEVFLNDLFTFTEKRRQST